MTTSLRHQQNQTDQDIEISRLHNLERMINTTEKFAKVGRYEWNWKQDCLESCSLEYASIFEMTIPEVMAAQSSWESTLRQIHPDDVSRYDQITGDMSKLQSFEIEYRILLEDKRVKHVREVCIREIDSDEKILTSFGILQDITEQVRRNLALKYRDDMVYQAESMTDIGHFIFDWRIENYTYLSEGYARILGTTVEAYMERIKSSEDDLADIHPDDRQRVQDEYNHYLKTAEECAIEYRIIRSNGQVRWIRELGKAQLVEDGKVLQTLGVVQDITEQVNREQDLMFNAAIASEVESIANMGYFLFDDKTDRNIFTSPGQAKIIGLDFDTYNEKIVTCNDYVALVYEEDQPLVRQAYEQSKNEQGNWSIEYRILKPDGELCWIHETGKMFKRDAVGIEQSIGLVRDITNQKMIEQALLDKDALANQAEKITDIGHFVFDELEECYLFVSPGLAEIHGVIESDLISSLTST